MNKLPVLKPNEVIKAFEKDGWVIKRCTGSHIIADH
ncbi:MAG TPA: addiction module toxin, HicA family [Candidatus Omnitrophica bacterium]|nr:addiction module toxin, HicA family [Candidatus Omnitrophota bacterium]